MLCYDCLFLGSFCGALNFQLLVFQLEIVEGSDSFFSSSVVNILEKRVAFVVTHMLAVLNQVKRFQFSTGFTQLTHLILLHLERNAAHKNPLVLYRLLSLKSLCATFSISFSVTCICCSCPCYISRCLFTLALAYPPIGHG